MAKIKDAQLVEELTEEVMFPVGNTGNEEEPQAVTLEKIKKKVLDDVSSAGKSGSYNDLTNKPTIPTKTSQLTNDSGFLTEHQSLEGYATETWVEGKGYLTEHQDISGKANISDLATVATSGNYEDLTNRPNFEVFVFTLEDGSTVQKKILVV